VGRSPQRLLRGVRVRRELRQGRAAIFQPLVRYWWRRDALRWRVPAGGRAGGRATSQRRRCGGFGWGAFRCLGWHGDARVLCGVSDC